VNPVEQVSLARVESRQQRMEAVWRERAGRLSRRPEAAIAGQAAAPVMVLGIGNERYGVDVAEVAEILPPVRATPVPGAGTVFAGVINVHGEIRPVIDLRRWLGIVGMEAAGEGDLVRVILLRRHGREIGLQIDSVEPIRWIGAGDLLPGGKNDCGSSARIKGSTKDLLMLLSTEALFAELETGVTT
jgi:chemotaxis signal transduction protein